MNLKDGYSFLTNPPGRAILFNGLFVYAVFSMRYVFPFLLLPYITRVLSIGGYGTYLSVVGTASFYSIILEFSAPTTGLLRLSISANKNDRGKIVLNYTIIKIVLFICATPMLYTINKFYLHLSIAYFCSMIAVSFFQSINLQWAFQGTSSVKTMTIIQIFGMTVNLGLIFLLVHTSGDALVAVGCQTASWAATFAISTYFIRRHAYFRMPDLASVLTEVKAGINGYVARILLCCQDQATIVTMTVLATVQQIGAYGMAEKLSLLMVGALPPLVQLTFPRVSRSWSERGRQHLIILAATLGAVTVASFVVSAILSYFGDFIGIKFLGAKFSNAHTIIHVLALLIIPASINAILSWQVFICSGRSGILSGIMGAGAFINVILCVTMIPTHGALGAAYARLFSEASILCALALMAVQIILKTTQGQPQIISQHRSSDQ